MNTQTLRPLSTGSLITMCLPLGALNLFVMTVISSDFIWGTRKLPFSSHVGKYFIKIGKISAKIHEIGKIKAIFGLGMTPI